jgi:hypothetical protein
LNRSRSVMKQEVTLRVLEAKALGGSILSISKDLNISERQTRKALAHIGSEVRDSLLSNFVSERIPIALAESLELNRIIIGKAMQIAEASHDARVKIEGLRLASQVSQSSNQLLADSHMIGRAIQRSTLVVHQVPKQPQPTEEAREASPA